MAADAWLAAPHDTIAYARLVAAVERRRAFLNPSLLTPPPAEVPEVLELAGFVLARASADEVGADRPPTRLGDLLAENPQTTLDQLRDAP